MKIFKFLKSRTFFINLTAAIIIVGVIIYVVMLSLDSYTHHDEYLKVPDFKGINKEECKQIAESQNIRIQIIDSLYVKNIKPGSVIDQHPKAGHNIKENRLIMLTICSSNPESIPFPDLKNSAFRQTLNTLNSLGFKPGKISYIDSKYKNLVLELKYKNDTISPGALIEKGSVIDLVLGRGNFNKVIIPLCLGKNIDKAKEEIMYSFLNVGKVYYDNSIKDENDRLKATVWKQSPEYQKNIRIEAGSKITLWMTIDKERIELADTIIKRSTKQ